MGSRSRKRQRRDDAGHRVPKPPAASPAIPPGTSRSEARAIETRAALVPLEPGERPGAVTLAAVIAVLIGLANIVLYLVGWDVRGKQPGFGGVLLFSGLMFAIAALMWKGRYTAVLAFQCLLAISALSAGVALLVASNIQAVVLCVLLLAGSGTMFWFLVKAMARLQMPERPRARPTEP